MGKRYPREALDLPAFRADLAAAEAACANPALRLWINDPTSVANAKPVASVSEAEGIWVNDYWLTVMMGVAVPYVDTLEIGADGALAQRWWRWFDPRNDEGVLAPKTLKVVPDLKPVALTGRLELVRKGVVRIADLSRKGVRYDLAAAKDPGLPLMRSRQILAARPGLEGEFGLAVTGDRMVVTGSDGVVRSYRRHDRRDLARMQALIRVGAVSAGQTWPCLMLQLRTGGAPAKKLREAGDFALEQQAIRDGFEKQSIASYNARILTGKPLPIDKRARRKAVEKMTKARGSPMAGWIMKQARSKTPFGCRRLFR